MTRRLIDYLLCAGIALFISTSHAEENSIPAVAMEFDAVVADPDHHTVLYEDDHIRIFELITMPGDTEPKHTHPYPAMSVYDTSQGSFETVDDSGERLTFGRNFELLKTDPAWPQEIVDAVNEEHEKFETALQNGKLHTSFIDPRYVPTTLTNTDTIPMHSYRIEFKRIEGIKPSVEKGADVEK